MSSIIQEMPVEERPRERMKRLGAGSLSNAELLALFIRTGTRGRSAINVGQDLLHKYGGLAKLGRLELSELSATLGIGPAKACQIMAAFELGARVAREQATSHPVDDPKVIYEIMQPQLAHLRHESVHVLTVDSKMRLMSSQEVSKGSVTTAIADVRDLLRPAIIQQAVGIILIHNHPSGDVTPSQADINITIALRKAADLFRIKLHDHMIIGRALDGKDPFFSFREHNLL